MSDDGYHATATIKTQVSYFNQEEEDDKSDLYENNLLSINDQQQQQQGSEPNDFLWKQIWVTSSIFGCVMSSSTMAGNSATLLPQLQLEIGISRDEESWIAAIVILAMIPGTFFSGWAMNRFGRKGGNLLAICFMFLGWFILYVSSNLELILLGRFFGGFSIGACTVSTTSYLAEASHPKYRSIMLSSISLALTVGLFFIHLIGTFLHWRNVALVMFIPITITAILVLTTRESHVWYLQRNDMENAKKSFEWYRGRSEQNQREFYALLTNQQNTTNINYTLGELMSECWHYEFLKPMLISCLYFITMQFSGTNVIVFYSIEIMQQTIKGLNTYVAMLIADFVRFFSSLIGSILTKYLPVRLLTMISGVGSALSLFLLALFVYLSKNLVDNTVIGIIPIVLLVIYIFFLSIGVIPLAWTVCGELLPTNLKAIGTTIITSTNFISFFIVVKTGPLLFDCLGTPATFVLYGMFITFGILILYFVLPETKNKTLQEIQTFFQR